MLHQWTLTFFQLQKQKINRKWNSLTVKRQAQTRSLLLMIALELWRWTYFDKMVFGIAIMCLMFWNLGENKEGEISAYGIFNRGQQYLAGEFRADQFEAQLRGQRATGSADNQYKGEQPKEQRPDGIRHRDWKQQPEQQEAIRLARIEAEEKRKQKEELRLKREREAAAANGMDLDVDENDWDIEVEGAGFEK